MDTVLGFIDETFDMMTKYKLEDIDLFRLLQIVDLRAEISIVHTDQRRLSHNDALRALLQSIHLADLCIDLSRRSFVYDAIDPPVLKVLLTQITLMSRFSE